MPRLWSAITLLFAAPVLTSALGFDCEGEIADGHKLVLKALKGPKQIHLQEDTGVSVHNTTFTIDVCDPIKRTSDIPSEEQCEQGTRVCGVKKLWHNGTAELEEVINIAGEYSISDGMHLEPKVEWIPNGASHGDAEQEGFRVTLHGGKHPFRDSKGIKQRTIIEFLCNKDLEGNENFQETDGASLRRRDDNDDDDTPSLPDLDKGKPLSFVSYKENDDVKTLRLKWETRYACEGARDAPPSKSSHWGFFTWLIIVLFLLAASYIIFGSWLNYNRYGARGWDLVPHGDTIRDLPYIIKDFAGNLMNRIRGDGSRGGYSAV